MRLISVNEAVKETFQEMLQGEVQEEKQWKEQIKKHLHGTFDEHLKCPFINFHCKAFKGALESRLGMPL